MLKTRKSSKKNKQTKLRGFPMLELTKAVWFSSEIMGQKMSSNSVNLDKL